MSPAEDDATTRAVDELNKRLSGTQRSMVRVTTIAAVVAGFAAGGWTMFALDFDALSFRLVVPVFLTAAMATLGLGGLAVRGVLGQLKGGWARTLARETGAD